MVLPFLLRIKKGCHLINLIKKTVIAASVTALLSACAGDSSDGEAEGSLAESFDFTGMMANYVDNLIVPRYVTFTTQVQSAAAQDGAIANYCSAIGTSSEASQRAAAQTQWREMMNTWQQAEIFIVGPAAENGNARRNAVYSFASNFPPNSCSVDQSVVLAQAANFDISARSFNSRGLDALEYLLFNDNLDHTCPVQIVETQGWNALSDSVRKQQRCVYAQSVVADISASGQDLVDRWALTSGNYRTRFVNPSNVEDSLSALSDALFYIEEETKDSKLGLPTGIQASCSRISCPEATESPFSETSLANIRENLIGFRAALMGGEGLGFDDIIIRSGFPNVVKNFNANIDASLQLIASNQDSLLQQSQAILASGDRAQCNNSAANPDNNIATDSASQAIPICSLHGLVKRITDSLRIDFVTIVDIDLPDRSQSDND